MWGVVFRSNSQYSNLMICNEGRINEGRIKFVGVVSILLRKRCKYIAVERMIRIDESKGYVDDLTDFCSQ